MGGTDENRQDLNPNDFDTIIIGGVRVADLDRSQHTVLKYPLLV